MGYYELVLEGRQGTEDMLNVIHYLVEGSDPPDWNEVAAEFATKISTILVPVSAPNTSWVGITVREDIPGAVGTFVPFLGGAIAGTITDPDVITQTAMLVRKFTDTLTRPNQGRAFHGGLSTRWASGTGFWEAAAVGAVEAFWASIREIIVAGPSTLSMVVKASNPTAPNTVPYNLVTRFSARTNPSTLKNRKRTTGS